MRIIPGGRSGIVASRGVYMDGHPGTFPSVACLNLSPTFGDVEGNLDMAEEAIRSAKSQTPSLRWVVLPELFTSGYSDLASIHRHAEDANRDMSAWRLSNLAHELDLYIAYGFPEKLEGGGVATSSNLVGPDAPGAIMTYRKMNLVETTPEHIVFTAGTEIPVVEVGGMRVAMLVCWDLGHPETVRLAALKGADLILAPAAWRDPWSRQYDLACAARALDNGIYVASANQLGPYAEADFSAHGGVYAPNGENISHPAGSTHESDARIATIDPGYPVRWREEFGDALGPERCHTSASRTSSGIA